MKEIDGTLRIWLPSGCCTWRWEIVTKDFTVSASHDWMASFDSKVIDNAVLNAETIAKRLGVRIVERKSPEIWKERWVSFYPPSYPAGLGSL